MTTVPAAYALALEGGLEVAGATPIATGALRGRAEVSTGECREPAGELLFSQPDRSGNEAVRLERVPSGYRMRLAGMAEFAIAADGTRVLCRGEVEPSWRWERVLAGHALPMAALLQGVEVLHASAVALDGRAIAIAASSMGGKSSLAVNLALRGARLLTDDALAVEPLADGTVLAHPGVGAASVRANEVARLRELGLYERLTVLGEGADAVRVLFDRHDEPVPLSAVYWPERDPALAEPEFRRLPADVRRLLTGTINLVLRGPERMRRHFEVSAAVAAAVPLYGIGVPPGMGAAALAEAIERHAAR